MAAICAVVVGGSARSGGQPEIKREASADVEQSFLNVFLPAPREMRQHVTRARRALQEQRYSDAVEQLGSLLTDPEAEDYFIGSPGDSGTQTSLKAEAQRLLGSIPPKGRRSYELQFGSDARLLLQQAVKQGDIQKLTDVTRMYFHTEAGYEATMLLGRYHLDHGRPLAGALCFKRIAESPAAQQYEPELSILLATCWLYANLPEKAEQTLASLYHRMPTATVRAGNRPFPLFSDPSDAVAWLTRITGKRAAAPGAEATQWLMFRGNPMRNAQTTGGLPLQNLRWRVPTVNDSADELLIREVHKQYLGSKIPALPGLHPLAVGNVVLMRTPERLLAVDFTTGKRIWVFPWADDSPYPADWQTTGRPDQPGAGSSRLNELNQRLWDDAPHGQLSSDGEAVFLLDELGFAIPTGFPVQLLRGGLLLENRNWPRSYNKLAALSLAKQGALLWVVGGADGEDEPKLAGAFFLGAPLPLLGQLYVLAEMNGEIRLVVLDRKTGRLQWSQQLAHVENSPILQDGPRRLAGASPSFADGVLVCPTSAGAVVAVDLSSRALLWGFQYQKAVSRYNRPFGRVYMRETRPVGNRWSDATATIAEGRVILTPVESQEMYCLDLLTGKSLWPAGKQRGQMLYVACVDRGNVVLVGKDGVRALALDDGQPVWTVPFADGEMPSGRGFCSGRYYYLPTSQSRVLKIDLADGQLAGQAETEFVLGNLLCYKGDVISHGVDWLAAFHQDKPLREKVGQRLAQNPDDAWALARYGELLLKDGKQNEAVAAIRRAFQLDRKNDTTRALLVKTLLAALREDYAKNQQYVGELEGLIDQPLERAEFLRLRALGLLQAGKTKEAFAQFVKMAGFPDRGAGPSQAISPRLENVDDHLSVRRDRWISKRLAELYDAADAAERSEMDAVIQKHLQAALESGQARQLRRFQDFFGFHPSADRARLGLVSRLVETGELLRAELLINQLAECPTESIRAAAGAHLARLLHEAGRLEDAAAQYRLIAQRWGDLVCLDGKTGRQLLDALPADGALGRFLKQPTRWAAGRIQVEAGDDRVINTPSYFRVYPIRLRQRRGQLPPGMSVALDQRANAVVVHDGRGKELARVSLSRRDGRPRFYTTNYAVTYCRANGHLLVLTMGYELVAIDLLQAAQGEGEAILWRQELAQSIPDPLGQTIRGQRVGSKSVENPWGASQYQATDAYGRLVGASASLGANGFCFLRQRELICVDPLSGQPIWVRNDLEPGSDLFGDDRYVFVTPPGGQEALVFDSIDGSLLGHRAVAERGKRWVSFGRCVLSWRQRQNRLELVFDDVWEQSTIWKRDFPFGSKGWIVQQDEVAVMQPDGKFLIWSMKDRQLKLEAQLQPEQILTNIYVFRSPDQYILVTNNPTTRATPNVRINPAPGGFQTPLVDGYVYALGRTTGRPQWEKGVRVKQFGLPLDQPVDVPVLTFLRHRMPTSSRGPRRMQTSVLCIDKRDGSVVFSRDDVPAHTYSYQIEGKLADQAVVLRLPGKNFTLRVTDEPKPTSQGEASPVQTPANR